MKVSGLVGVFLTLAAVTVAPCVAQTSATTTAEPSVWRIDSSHSELSFTVRHLLSRVRGTFGDWGGTIVVDPERLSQGRVEVEIAAASLDTNNEKRDQDLQGPDFFDADAHPTITFRSRSVEASGGDLRIVGDLTIRGVTRPVVLEGSYLGTMQDGQGRSRLGFEADTTIDRHDFGITWNRMVEGGNLLGDEVTITIAVQAIEER